MKKIQYFCDICDVEFPPKEFSFLTGQIIKLDDELKQNVLAFEWNFCGECTKMIVDVIDKTKAEKAKHE